MEDAEAPEVGADVVCARTCPRAVVSSSFDGSESPQTGDPPVRVHGRVDLPSSVLNAPGGDKNHVLAVAPRSVVRVGGSGPGDLAIEVLVGGQVTRTPISTSDVIWIETADGRRAIAQLYERTGFSVQRFVLRAGVWEAYGPVVGHGSRMACIAGDGTLLLDRPLRFVAPDSTVRRVPDVDSGGACGFFRGGAVVAQYSSTVDASGSSIFMTVVRAIDLRGRVTWKETYDNTDAGVSAGEDQPYFTVANGETVWVMDASGRNITTIDEAQDARFVETGELVVLHADGSLTWASL